MFQDLRGDRRTNKVRENSTVNIVQKLRQYCLRAHITRNARVLWGRRNWSMINDTMSNRWGTDQLIFINGWSMNNRWPERLWFFDCSLVSLIMYRCYRILIDFILITYWILINCTLLCISLRCYSSTQHITTLLLTTHVWPPYGGKLNDGTHSPVKRCCTNVVVALFWLGLNRKWTVP